METNICIHPKVTELQTICEELKQSFAGLIGEYDRIKDKILPTIEKLYQVEFGQEIHELMQAEFDVKAMKYRISKLQIAVNHNEKISLDKVEAEIKTEFVDWLKRIAEQEIKNESAELYLSGGFLSAEESCKLQSIYRELARLLHPDVANNFDERKNELWLMVSEAYKDGDLERLVGLKMICELETGFSDEKFKPENSIERFEKIIDELKIKIEKYVKAIAELRKSETFILGENLEDREWLGEQHNIFKANIVYQKSELEKLQARFLQLLAEVSVEESNSDEWDEIIEL